MTAQHREKPSGTASAQQRLVGRKQKYESFAAAKRDVDEGFRYFQNNRPVGCVRPGPGRPKKAEPGTEKEGA